MTADLYLIAHKVRGASAFDVASQIEVEGEVWWIIPTSGHRAYPYWSIDLPSLTEMDSIRAMMPPDLDDHYPLKASTEAPKPSASGLLAALGLGKPKVTITRRV